MRRLLFAVLCCLALPGGAGAHPHVFIDAGLTLIFDRDGRLAAVRVAWVYDELFSLLILQDMELDGDYDGVLTDEELARLRGFDMDWTEGYAGDLFVLADGREQRLSGPLDPDVAFRDGRIITTHLRALEPRLEVGTGPVIFQVYDPGFYTAYEISLPPRVEGRAGCAAQVFAPDLDAAYQALEDALAELGPTDDAEEMGYPAVGANFAEEVRLTCAPSF
ncbi:DUF1007 family protein [Actibacterium sp. D379-3]